jgi:hypothetical protein
MFACVQLQACPRTRLIVLHRMGRTARHGAKRAIDFFACEGLCLLPEVESMWLSITTESAGPLLQILQYRQRTQTGQAAPLITIACSR